MLRAASSSFEHARLQAELRVQSAAVEASRTRVVVAADAECRRVERNIHEGAQQRLVALALSLRPISAASGRPLGPDALHVIDGTVTQLQKAVDELRALAQGSGPCRLGVGGTCSSSIGPSSIWAKAWGRDVVVDTPAGFGRSPMGQLRRLMSSCPVTLDQWAVPALR